MKLEMNKPSVRAVGGGSLSATASRGVRARGRHRLLPLMCALGLLVAGCADFSQVRADPSVQPTLTPREVYPVQPAPPRPGVTPSESSPSPTEPPDPCRPADVNIVAACVDSPWALVPVSENAAIVGERTTGRVLYVEYQSDPVELTTVPGVDGSGDGGLLGLALSPSYGEDGLMYAYVTTKDDNRVLRLADGDEPTPILTGIPKGSEHNGGPIGFIGDDLYVATGDTGDPDLAADLKSLAGKVLRIDVFGKPHGGVLDPSSPVLSYGLTQPTGSCLLPDGSWGVLDQRAKDSVLLRPTEGADLSAAGLSAAGTAPVWTWPIGEGGAADCAADLGVLAATSTAGQQVWGIDIGPDNSFLGAPRQLLGKDYGRPLTIEPGPGGLFWVTTANAGTDTSTDSDDLVFVIPNGGGGGGGGID